MDSIEIYALRDRAVQFLIQSKLNFFDTYLINGNGLNVDTLKHSVAEWEAIAQKIDQASNHL